ncbi:MAG: NAD(P)H-dependent oxidoreductase subunit E [Anaerolineae bacterium]|nr:NAD(P)H-dependent oxidoreductase subunit E [Anaerolineae bacterium]
MVGSRPTQPTRQLADELYEQLDAYIETLQIDPDDPYRRETLIRSLHRAQEIFGYLPAEVQRHVAGRYAISHAEVSGVISFYNYFTTTPKGKVQIDVCLGTACYVNGADKVLQEFERILNIKSGEVTPDGQFSIESLRCVGACSLAPVVTVNGKVYGRVQPEKVQEILEHYLVEIDREEEPIHVKN